MSASEAKQVLRKFHPKCGKNIKLSHERRVTGGKESSQVESQEESHW